MTDTVSGLNTTGLEIAIVGMAGRFPGAPDIDSFWRNIRDGVESIVHYSDDELRQRGVSEALLADPAYVKAGIPLEGMDLFDAGFFGYTARNAEQLDPQHRIFLECAWEALEHAGYDAERTASVGIYAGVGASIYLIKHLLSQQPLTEQTSIAELLALLSGNMTDALATRVAYKLNLRGPAVSVQTACSTSLMAVHTACQALLGHECDMALAGGVSLNLLQNGGYSHQLGAILSPDGHCRAFDAKAAGTVLGSGAGVVVLKRLDEALQHGDTIHAVIKGSAANNDGADKVGFTAPSVSGQAAVIRTAQMLAGVTADSIGYVETHGTGTTLGDPIEVAALSQAFRADTQGIGFCAIGSVKTNVGHLDAAAGVTGLIKTVLALKHKTLPPSLHFTQPNPQIDFDRSAFYVNTLEQPWLLNGSARRAGVSSFGIGGTNVHMILEEAPEAVSSRAEHKERREFLLLSARSPRALDESVERLAQHIDRHPKQALADSAYTLRTGRKRFEHRAVAVARDAACAVEALAQRAAPSFVSGNVLSDQPTVTFLFPGQGAQHVNMGRELYDNEPVFRQVFDRCCDYLLKRHQLDLRSLVFAAAADEAEATQQLAQTALTQPALFVMEYALAHYWLAKGLQPDALLGHSIGEYVAACLAGVFSLEDALHLVVARGQLIQSTAPGAMLAVNLPSEQLQRFTLACDLAAVNAPDWGVLAGTPYAIEAIERELNDRGVPVRRLHVSHAFHSALLEPVLSDFRALLCRIERQPPRIPFISNVTGQWITAEEACSVDYWVRHLRSTVLFDQGLQTLLTKPDRVLLEVGPGDTLSRLARRQPQLGERPVLTSQCHPREPISNLDQLAYCLAGLWVAGIELDALAGPSRQVRRVPLPTYPFERQSYWISHTQPQKQSANSLNTQAAGASYFYVPNWQRCTRMPPAEPVASGGVLLLLGGEDRFTDHVQERLAGLCLKVVRIIKGSKFRRIDIGYEVRPAAYEDFVQLLNEVKAQLGPISAICHMWSLNTAAEYALEYGFYSVLALAQALSATAARGEAQLSITLVANQAEDITGNEPLCPEKATLHGPCKVIPQEFPDVFCRLIDVVTPSNSAGEERLTQQIAQEICAGKQDVVALRGAVRWVKGFEPVPQMHRQPLQNAQQRLRPRGVYLITGGLGGIGLTLARYLAEHWQARLVLIGRSALPPRDQWRDYLAATDTNAALVNRLRSLQELERLGAEVLTVQADVSDAAQLQSAIERARQQFGSIDGAIHAAGVAGGGMIANRTREAVEQVMAAKLHGARNLVTALRAESVPFILLCSSLSALVGGFGQIDYCAANRFLDALAASENQQGHNPVISVNWDTWREVGMAAGHSLPEGWGISPSEAGGLFESLVNKPIAIQGASQVAVSKVALERQFAQSASTELADRLLKSPASGKRHPRPSLKVPYVAVEGEFEADLAMLWGEALGIEPIGRNDHFFELGGDSLLAIQLIARVRRDYGVNIHPTELFKSPTIAALSLLIETRLIEEIEAVEATS